MIKVLVADDQITVREILKSYIETDTGLELVSCASNGEEAIEQVKKYQPHIVLMDIEMPVMDGLTATEIISEQFVNTNVLIISVHNEDTHLQSALEVGAKGYLKKNTPEKELIHAIYSAYKGYFQLGPGLLEHYLYRNARSQQNSQEIKQLKSVILQQSKLLDSINREKLKNRRSGNKNSSQTNQYHALEKQIYYISDCLNKLNKRVYFVQAIGTIAIFCSGILGIALLIFLV